MKTIILPEIRALKDFGKGFYDTAVPSHAVTISDVIAETGMSMGAIYRYYEGLDDILADMVMMMRSKYDSYERIEELSKEKGLSFEEITYRACDIIGEVMEEHLSLQSPGGKT